MAIVGLGATGCALRTSGTLDVTEINEVVVRWAVANAETNLHPPAAYCLGYTDSADTVDPAAMKDPPRELLERLKTLPAPVRPVSECNVIGGGEHSVVDAATRGYGLLIGIGLPETKNSRTTVPVGYMQGGDVGLGWECAVRRASGRWVIGNCEVVYHI